MNVLLISTNRNRNPVTVMPFGACLVAEAVEKDGHNVKFLDLMQERNSEKAINRILDAFTPDVIGMSLRNIDNNDMKTPAAFYRELKPLMDSIRKKTSAPVVLGGAAMAVMPEHFLRFTGAPFAVLGSGEVVFPILLSAIAGNGKTHEIPGVGWIENGIYRENKRIHASGSDKCHVPDFGKWIDVNAYKSQIAAAPVQSKTGCSFKCVYCTYPVCEGQTYQCHDPESVADAVEKLVSQGFTDIEFVDNVFNVPYWHALEVCNAIASRKTGARLQTVELNPGFIDEKLLTAMEKAGFTAIGVTAESASDPVLEGLGKNFTSIELKKAAMAIRNCHIPCLWIFMFGGPNETKDTVNETIKFAEKYVRPGDAALLSFGIRIYPGTELENVARKEGSLNVQRELMLDPVFYVSPGIDAQWLEARLKEAAGSNMNFICPGSLQLPFLPFITRISGLFGLKKPMWRNTKMFRKILNLLGANV
jgi:radical SAM superfamily enzyme YgiQ (UPF0313 family)